MRVAGYVRVSDESQMEGYSLAAQRAEIARWCDRRGHELAVVYAEEGVSAHTDKLERRPQLQQLLNDATSSRFDLVVVHTLDRWARNVGVQRQALQMLGDARTGFASVTEEIDFTTPSGKLMLTMIGGVAEFFSDQLGVHVRKGLHGRTREGLQNGDIPFAYLRCTEPEIEIDPATGRQKKVMLLREGCPTPAGHPGGVHVVRQEADAVLQLFQSYAAGGWTQADAASWLNLHGFRTRNKRDTGRGAGPQAFTTWSVRDILANPFYAGLVRWNGQETFQGQHESIISLELWQACQAVKHAHRRHSSTYSAKTRAYLLKGLLRCAVCGEAYWAERAGRQRRSYYRGARRGQSCECQARNYRVETIDGKAGLLVYALTLPSDWLDRARERIAASAPSVDARKGKLTEQRRRMSNLYAAGEIGDAEWRGELARIEQQTRSLEVEPADEASEAVTLLGNLEMLWRAANVSERNRILSALVEAVYVDLDGQIVGIEPKTGMGPLWAAVVAKDGCGVTLTPSPPHIPNASLVGGVETGEN